MVTECEVNSMVFKPHSLTGNALSGSSSPLQRTRRRVRRNSSSLSSSFTQTSSVDPVSQIGADRVQKLRNQQEVCHIYVYFILATSSCLSCHLQRQTLAYILVRQAIGLLQRTKLHVTIECQAWHAKNSRHMLLGRYKYYMTPRPMPI